MSREERRIVCSETKLPMFTARKTIQMSEGDPTPLLNRIHQGRYTKDTGGSKEEAHSDNIHR